jgi:hypothetical protein
MPTLNLILDAAVQLPNLTKTVAFDARLLRTQPVTVSARVTPPPLVQLYAFQETVESPDSAVAVVVDWDGVEVMQVSTAGDEGAARAAVGATGTQLHAAYNALFGAGNWALAWFHRDSPALSAAAEYALRRWVQATAAAEGS